MQTSSSGEPALLPSTLRDWMDGHAGAGGDSIACTGPQGAISYRDLHALALALAAEFQKRGIKRGDVVAVQLPNGPEFLLSYLAAGYAGAILQTIHMPYRAAEIVPLLQHSGAKLFIGVSRIGDFSPVELVLDNRGGMPALTHVMAADDNPINGAIPFSIYQNAMGSMPQGRPEPDDDFVLLYTSGTTAAPKGVPVPYRKFLSNAFYSARELELGATSILLSAAPFTHLYGLFSINLALSCGATIAILPAFTPKALAGAFDTFKPTAIFVAPAHVAACLNEGLVSRQNLASLSFALISGSVCPPDLANNLQNLMPDGAVCQLWGMSEMQAGTFTRPKDPAPVRLTTAGRASPGTELRVLDGAGAPCVDKEGELQVRGLSVFAGYLSNSEATRDAFTADGWFRTGDLARIDAQGNIQLTGRLKDVINRGGVKFNPADIELVISQHPAVADCAIVPVPDPVLGERACCFVVLKPGATLDLEQLKTWFAERKIAKNKWPERLETIDAFPMTPTRKVKKADLARLVSEQR